ncbi:acetate kinase [Synechococcus sp. RSCCF101]|uniref:acetate/propionate family kinase n=1 Tax=Synechococcus sp. RSCCF101 TaxID=2511069 RepID=UPI001245E0BF|nr:acetate kinase [Synechococcus sp. RSCCF101]QEY32457.1 acetate kinase [Synechococcus sp. RSCCF101]
MEPADLVLVINLGSSSLKAALVAPDGSRPWQLNRSLADPGASASGSVETTIQRALDTWLAADLAPWRDHIALAGHRVVHGGERFTATTAIDGTVLTALEALSPLAPLHNPPALAGIRWLQTWAPERPQFACFDTAFHSSLPPEAATYALPERLRRQGLRRFGFHGINHQHVAERCAGVWREQGRDPDQLRLISAHLGAGCSLAAVAAGRCIDTTMGYTPLDGLVMATRSGSLDPGLLIQLLRSGMAVEELEHTLQHDSGLRGLSGGCADMRQLRERAVSGDPPAELAIGVFRQQLLRQLGAMAASLGGIDMIALTGGIGEHDRALQAELQARLGWLRGCQWLVVPADEEGMIARLCRRTAG